MLRPLAFAAALCALGACATAPVYAPASGARASGYSHAQIEADRYFVTYRAPSGAEAALVEDFTLLRAAELTLEQGKDWFIVDRRTSEPVGAVNTGPRVGVGVGGGSFGRSSGVSGSVGLSFPIGSGSGPRVASQTLEIRTGSGAKPDEPNAYDARSVSQNLRSRILAQ